MLPKPRLGKRSPFGALLLPAAAAGARADQEVAMVGVAVAAGQQAISGVRGHPGLKVNFWRAAAGEGAGEGAGEAAGEGAGAPDQSELTQSDAAARRPPLSSVSSCIDVPRSHKSPEEVDMDEMMAAMVLSSLSCSPLLHGSAHLDPAAPPMDAGGGGSELSDSGSSGYWSVGHGNRSPAPSPPMAEPDGAPADEGLEMELEQVLFNEPAPRKRRNSVKVAFRCLWPGCGKVLTSVVGIKRHIRITHLCRGSEHERCSRSEEDFYYTEISQWSQPQQQSPPLLSSPSSLSPRSPPSPPPPSPPSPPSPADGALSRSAPSSGSFWQVQSEHSYQAPPPSHVEAAAVASCRWVAPPTSCHRQTPSFRIRSVSVGEQWLQNQNQSAPCRRIRGEAKKCRKVYGIEHREQWCTACRWKKACQRFLD